MLVQVCCRDFTHLTSQRTILMALLRGIPDDGTCDVPKHVGVFLISFNPLKAELNPICHFLALLGGATIVVVSRLRVK